MNRNDLKEYFARLKRGQQDAFTTSSSKRSLLSESYGDSNDPYNPKANPNLVSLEMDAPIGGGLGRGLDSARQNLKKALNDLYQEVVDGVTDEYGADETDGTNQIAYEDTARHVNDVVKDFMFGISVPSAPVDLDYGSFEAEEDALDALRNPDYDEDTEEDDDPIRRMGFSDYSQEYKDMGKSGRFYDK